MTLAVVSDLHLGSGDALDRFGHDEARFLRFLDHLETHHERIVLLGDIFETLDGTTPDSSEERLRQAVAAHRAVVRRMLDPRYVWILGNHDAVTGPMLGARSEWLLDKDGVRLYFTHGHLGDPTYAKARVLAETAVWLGGWLRRLGWQALFRFFERLDVSLSGVQPEPEACPFRRWAVEEARRRSADVVVTGHSHEGGRSLHGSRWFLNSGTCSEGQTSFLSIDTRALRFDYVPAW